ncbi:bifunctional diguanylate cyclase/phosphodiesterase [Vibrio diazotrophicus]|uniref:bifunctional diguanylate cyclase/phosphodiesterase n=1 Tax=Vibrio diazotrophicus TaxID=685 RepID=UPI000C9E3B36|nr:EAL domain-containing protein [Vibrio diazotrophicus]PNH91609.1 sensor domain-containing phosphodiesterase [Vibrio diazotrophicus]
MFTSSLLITAEQSVKSVVDENAVTHDGITLIQLFSSQPPSEVVEIANQLLDVYPNAHIIGMSSSNVIHQGSIHKNATLLVFTHFKNVSLSSAVVNYTDHLLADSSNFAQKLNLQSNSKAIICFASRMEFARQERITQFSQFSPVPIFGGASSRTDGGRWVLLGNEFFENAIVGVAFHSDTLHLTSECYTEWNPIGRQLTVTKATGRNLQSLDGESVHTVYDRYLGDSKSVPLELLQHFPLIKGESKKQDVYLPLSLSENGILLNRELKVGDKVRFCFDHPSLTLGQVQLGAERLQKFQPDQIFVYNCLSRLEFMHGNTELIPLQEVANCYGCYCAGELIRTGEHQQMLHHSLTFLALREGEAQISAATPAEERQGHNVIAPLFSLIRNALADVDRMNRNLEKKIQTQASLLIASYRVDKRTGLPNREVLHERLALMGNNDHLITLKLTNFSLINEKYGYQVGDKLLQDLSDHFQQYMNKMLAGRSNLYAIGVGEWACVFRSDFDSEYIHQQFSMFVEQLENFNFEPYGLPEVDYLSVSLCAGFISRRDFPNLGKDELLLRSIEARRFAQNQNRHFYCASDLRTRDQVRQEQLSWLSCVSRAVLGKNVQVFAQPIVKAKTHELSSYECLVRIEDNGEIILPGRFLPIVEGTHLYSRLSRQMISRTFELMHSRSESFSINLSPQDFMSDKTLRHLEDTIQKLADPTRVGLEVLETEQIKDYGHMIEVCNHFRSLGASIIVDDFGCGYSNIDEIVKLEPQIIKLDGSLIRNIDKDVKQRKIAQQLVRLCQVLDAKTVAEFVHNEEVCRISEDMGIDYLQGFYLGQPSRLT